MGHHGKLQMVKQLLSLAALVLLPLSGCGDEVVQTGSRSVQLLGAQDLVSAELPGDVSSSANPYACPGGYGCPCSGDSDCTEAPLCLKADAAESGTCAVPCPNGSCESGKSCRNIAEKGWFCVEAAARLCDPCAVDADCQTLGHAGAACVNYGAIGRFCGVACTGDADCGAGYACRSGLSTSGSAVQQCVKLSADGKTQVECGCSERAKSQKLATACGSAGCAGSRSCGESGLSACSAATAAAETCNGIDDDCDGETDEIGGPAGSPAALCDDKNACTSDICDPSKGCVYTPKDSGACSDGDACTKDDACAAGKCKGGAALNCDDANACSSDGCDAIQGCQYSWPAKGCDDGNPCTGGDTCKNGQCKGGAPTLCDDKNPCTADICEPSLPEGCTAVAVEGGACTDGDACTGGDTCSGGACLGQKAGCDDANPCTKDSCDSAKGCVNLADDGTGCDDNNPCTSNELCNKGQCKGGAPKVCSSDNPCLVGVCLPSTGECGAKIKPDGTACSDGQVCTTGDACSKGECAGMVTCNDKDACTTDYCGIDGKCAHSAIVSGSCAPDNCKSLDCDDKNPCTKDNCDAKGCQHAADDTASCDDASACTSGDACKTGTCSGTPLVCDDKNPCTTDSCDKAKGCGAVNLSDGASCSDANPCTAPDGCSGGVCKGSAVVCDDKNPCTADSCDAKTGCVAAPLDASPCDDGNACTKSDSCAKGACSGAGSVTCTDDGNACTKEACDAAKGCTSVVDDTSACTDGDPCTEQDACKSGSCKGTVPADSVGVIAGSGVQGFANATGTAAQFTFPVAVVRSVTGVIYVADAAEGGARIRKIASDGAVTTLAGQGLSGFADGGPNQAKFWNPSGLAVDGSGNVYVADRFNQRIRQIAPDGTVTTLAGSAPDPDFLDPKAVGGYKDGIGAAAQFDEPAGLALAPGGVLYVVEAANHRVRLVFADGTVTTAAGSGTAGSSDGAATSASFNGPTAVAVGSDGAVYIADTGNHLIRKLDKGQVTTVAGSTKGFGDGDALTAKLDTPSGLAISSGGEIFIIDSGNHALRSLKGGSLATLVGGSSSGDSVGTWAKALFKAPRGVWMAGPGSWLIADSGNFRIKQVISPVVACPPKPAP